MEDLCLEDVIDDCELPEWLDTEIAGGNPLNSRDYSLNSPLISDFLDALCRYITTHHELDPRYLRHRALFEGVREQVIKYKLTINEDHKNCHRWAGRHLTNLQSGCKYRKLIEGINKDCSEMEPLLKAFFQAWGITDSVDVSKIPSDPWWPHYGGLFLSWHQVTLIMNSQSETERSNLQKTVKGLIVEGVPWYYKCFLSGLGNIIIWSEVVLLLDHGILIERNFVLMMKDLLIARTQTLCSTINRVDNKYDQQTYELMLQLYQLGDLMLKKFGDQAYECLKMIEPMCNLRLADLAHAFRPLIPDFPHFRTHVEQTVRELELQFDEIREIFILIERITRVDDVLVVFSSFRHWGHPYIAYLEGLEKLHNQVTMKKNIDVKYANVLASDLAYMVLKKHFENHKSWAVKRDMVSRRHPLHEHIMNSTWPTPKQIEDFGDKWHELPLDKIFDIPDLIDPSMIYADKSHSMNRSEVLDHVRMNPNTPIPTRKVLKTLLEKPATNWPEFLKRIEEHGLEKDSLIIGLKGKERELKKSGRFFSLMSWELREYFVITEHLIKQHFVPMFKGLTMADDMTAVIKKMLERSQGQGENDYEHVSIANHIDYEKWNNHQRKESNGPVFRVMGQFLGYPTLIERTHEFFEKSLIYYNGRPDLMEVEGDMLVNKHGERVCWNGQAGGLEGLRQKGWSILNLLVIRREAKIRNTRVQTLAQGDNQVICTQYKLQPMRNEQELRIALNQIKENNDAIMSAVEVGINKLGLIINNDETIQSADFLTYGKVPIFRGNIRGLETKRWSRVMCVTNDQLPSMANVMSSVSTNALTVSHFSEGPVEPIRQYLFFGNFARRLVEYHDPALRMSLRQAVDNPKNLNNVMYKAGVLFLDPSLGGVCGMSLTRFFMRMFPDPISESLTFWKKVHDHTEVLWVKQMARLAGHPELARSKEGNLAKLVENPAALNLRKETSALSVIKNEVKLQLYRDAERLKNKMISDSITQSRDEEPYLEAFLAGIRPLFPRFLSEFRSASFLGITDSLVGLFQNSKTIRNIFRTKYAREIEDKVVRCEIMSIKILINLCEKTYIPEMWECSSSKADQLRFESWGTQVIGATVPHPMEMLRTPDAGYCSKCNVSGKLDYITLNIVESLVDCTNSKGPMPAYLGSKTSETTSILQPWEKDTKIPVIKRAANLRSAISWFVAPDSLLAEGILNNLASLTGEDWSGMIQGFKRTGSALHRFSSSRISSGGFAAQSPARLTRMMSTTDTFREIGDDNYDFMFQSLLIYSQIVGGELFKNSINSGVMHFHLDCQECMRKIEEPILEAEIPYRPTDKSHILNTWKPETTKWSEDHVMPDLSQGDWNNVGFMEMSFHVGRAEGFLFGDLLLTGSNLSDQSSIFPLSIQRKVYPLEFFDGVIDGLIKSSALSTIHRRNFEHPSKFRSTFFGTLDYLVDQLTLNAPFCNLIRSGPLSDQLISVPHKVPPTYPLSQTDLGALGRNYFRQRIKFLTKNHSYKPKWYNIWIFSDMMSPQLINPFILAQMCSKLVFAKRWGQKERDKLMVLRNTAHEVRKKIVTFKLPVNKHFMYTDQEIRHACKYTLKTSDVVQEISYSWGQELICDAYSHEITYSRCQTDKILMKIGQRRDPLISGLRLFQLATGAHYKLRALIKEHRINYDDFICGGDGSGGITSALLRMQPFSRCIFNSLLETKDMDLRGSAPSPPSAVKELGIMAHRCVNLSDVWKNPSDLSDPRTWEYFLSLKNKFKLKLNLMVFDMEVRCKMTSQKIEDLIISNLDLIEIGGTLIYKTYLSRLEEWDENMVGKIGGYFKHIYLSHTLVTSSHSSEVYLVAWFKLQKRSLNTYPVWSDVYNTALMHPCTASTEQELKRALEVQKLDMWKGVPTLLVSDLETDITTLSISIGVENGVSVVLGEEIMLYRESNPIHSILYWTIICCNQVLSPMRLNSIPSNGLIQNVIGLLTGVGLFFSLQSEKLQAYINLKSCLDDYAPFYIRGRNWNTTEGLNKSVRLDNKLALIGSVIRVCSRIGRTGSFSLSELNSKLMVKNKKLTIPNIKKKTGIFDYLTGVVRPKGVFMGTSDQPEEKVAAWRD
ncbi:large protein [Harbour porpoise rhabdovirus]|uniref:Replicase n=1 Tax=Harbour porpoise rhabdovirus TaxID=2598784 RepID=A0AAE6M1F8_9RHAB|nr:large protein [Harbour porpoise rhabdovirus]QDZ59981.1 large protein [Harbour porpoise rhabdovirus]